MNSNNKQIRDVADVAAQIMFGQQPVTEKLHPNQQKLDVHEPEKDELTSDDFKKLRAGKKADVKKEEVEQIDELSTGTLKSYISGAQKDRDSQSDSKNSGDREEAAYAKKQIVKRTSGIVDAKSRMNKEEVEQIDEVKMADLRSTKVQGRAYGASRPEPHAVDTMKGPIDAELKKIETEKKKKKFSEMVNLYQDKGLKSLSEMLAKEESTEDEFNKEIEDAKAKDAGKKKNTEIAKGAVQAVKTEETHTTVEVIDLNDVNGVQYSEIELAQERTLTEPEMKKKEEIVKSMKKGISGFKERYGSRAKNVMYATATKRAMGEEVEQIEEGTPEGYQRRDGKLIPKIHPTMTPHEHGYDYTMQSIEDAPSKAKIHSQHKEIVKDNPHPQGSKEHKDWEAGTNKAKADHLKDFS